MRSAVAPATQGPALLFAIEDRIKLELIVIRFVSEETGDTPDLLAITFGHLSVKSD